MSKNCMPNFFSLLIFWLWKGDVFLLEKHILHRKKCFFQVFWEICFSQFGQKLGTKTIIVYFYMRIGIQCPNVLSWHIIHPPWWVCGVLICFDADLLAIENWHPLLHQFRWMLTRCSFFFIGSIPILFILVNTIRF